MDVLNTRTITRAVLLIIVSAAGASAVVAFDATGSGNGTTSLAWTHTPVGTPQGVFVFCMNDTNADVFSGVTYGSATLTLITGATDSAGEPGFTEAYFLGSSIPTGAQTVTCTVSSGSTSKSGVSITVTANGDTQTAGTASCTVSADAANPSCSITSISGASFASAGFHSGLNACANVTAGTGFTAGPCFDYGMQVTASEYATTQQGSGDWTVAFTAGSDDVAMVGVAIQQTVADVVSGSRLSIMGVGP